MSLRRVWRAVGAGWRHCNAGGPEWIIVLAIAGLLLATGDGVCSWLLAVFAPALESRFNSLDNGCRVLLAGVPSATIYLAGVLGMYWWNARRKSSP